MEISDTTILTPLHTTNSGARCTEEIPHTTISGSSSASTFHYQPRSLFEWGARRYQSAGEIVPRESVKWTTFFDRVPFQYFIGINPVFIHSITEMRQFTGAFIEQCDRHHHAPTSCVIGYDSLPSAHAHLCMASSYRLESYWLHRYLRVSAGPEAYDIKPYIYRLDGLLYTLRVCDRYDKESIDWDFHRMNYYFPQSATTCWDRKKLRRHQKRLAGSI